MNDNQTCVCIQVCTSAAVSSDELYRYVLDRLDISPSFPRDWESRALIDKDGIDATRVAG